MISSALFLALTIATPLAAGSPPLYKPPDGSRTRPVHLIPLYDEEDELILGDAEVPQEIGSLPDLPFSARNTCGKCHDYDAISHGWHFDAPFGNAPAGRPGEPWFVVDRLTGTQLPVSNRAWPGAWQPEEAGLTPWRFTLEFGRHMPGGGWGELAREPAPPEARWRISGKLEINCLGCHNVSGRQDPSEWAIQVARENLRWAASAACGIGIVENVASRVPDWWSRADGANPDNDFEAPPTIEYDKTQFDRKHRVFFDISRRPPAERCNYCHSTAYRDEEAGNRWTKDPDVHLAAGMACTDCHRNGIDHMMVRGYEGKARATDDPAAASLSCEGCHLGEELTARGTELGGRLRAPRPQHKGLPAVHFEKLTCTACHSGPQPTEWAGRARTSRANRLGIHGKAQWETAMPFIASPVYMTQAVDGRIAPHHMTWPAFWARIKDGKARPLSPDRVMEAAGEILDAEKRVAGVLSAIDQAQTLTDAPAYVDGGKVYRLAGEGKLTASSVCDDLGPGPQWARWQDGRVAPLVIDVRAWKEDELTSATKPLNRFQIQRVLEGLKNDNAAQCEPVLISQGKLYRLELPASNDPSIWPKVVAAEITTPTLAGKTFWGDLKEGQVSPLDAEATRTSIGNMLQREGLQCRTAIAGILLALTNTKFPAPAYFNGSKIYTLGEKARTAEAPEEEMVEADYAGAGAATWAVMENGKASPLVPDFIGEALRATFGAEKSLTENQVALALGALNASGAAEGEAVYVCDGGVYRMRGEEGLDFADDPLGRPYAWPFGHDVRPASQSLGARSCEECHAADAPFFFGEAKAAGPLITKMTAVKNMRDLQEAKGPAYVRTGRLFKWFIIVTMGLLILHILGDLVRRAKRGRTG